MNYIIVDLEATCWERREGRQNEIIEIGAVCVGDDRLIKGEFCEFVRPKENPQLSTFCTNLTSIAQETVDAASLYPEVVSSFLEWIKNFGEEFVLCSWGHYDRVQFKNDCELHGLQADWTGRHISLKHQYAKIKGLRRAPGMSRALKSEGFKLEGTHHRGIDDAKNILKIFIKYYAHWDFDALYCAR